MWVPGGLPGSAGFEQSGSTHKVRRFRRPPPCRHARTYLTVALPLTPSPTPATAPQKANAQKKAEQLEGQRDAAVLEARRWQHQAEQLEAQAQLLREQGEPAAPASPSAKPSAACSGGQPEGAVQQLAVLQQQLESLAEGGLPALQQERARMSICLQTIKVGANGSWGKGEQGCAGLCWLACVKAHSGPPSHTPNMSGYFLGLHLPLLPAGDH